MRSTRTAVTHCLVDEHLSQRLGAIIGDEPGTRTVVVIFDPETAAELGLGTDAHMD